MPFIPALVEAAVGIGEAVAAGAEAAATVGATAGAEAGATGAAVGAEAGAIGAEAGAVGGEVGAVGGEASAVGGEASEVGEVAGEGSSSVRNLGDMGKEIYKGAKKGYDIADNVNSMSNTGSNNNNVNVGVHPLASAIESMNGGSSVDAASSLLNHDSLSIGFLQQPPESGRAPIANAHNVNSGQPEDIDYLADIGPERGSGNMRI